MKSSRTALVLRALAGIVLLFAWGCSAPFAQEPRSTLKPKVSKAQAAAIVLREARKQPGDYPEPLRVTSTGGYQGDECYWWTISLNDARGLGSDWDVNGTTGNASDSTCRQ